MAGPFFKKGNKITLDGKRGISESVKKKLGNKKFVVQEISWSCCACECGQRRDFDSKGECRACGLKCRQFVWINGQEPRSEIFKLVKAAET